MIGQCGRVLTAALGFAALSTPSYDRALHALLTWLDLWAGIGRVAVGMHRQGYDLQLTRYDEKGSTVNSYSRSFALVSSPASLPIRPVVAISGNPRDL